MSSIDGTLAAYRGINGGVHMNVPTSTTVQSLGSMSVAYAVGDLVGAAGPLTSLNVNGGYVEYTLNASKLLLVQLNVSSLVSSGAGTITFTVPDFLPAGVSLTFNQMTAQNHLVGSSASATIGSLTAVPNGVNTRSLDVTVIVPGAETWDFDIGTYIGFAA